MSSNSRSKFHQTTYGKFSMTSIILALSVPIPQPISHSWNIGIAYWISLLIIQGSTNMRDLATYSLLSGTVWRQYAESRVRCGFPSCRAFPVVPCCLFLHPLCCHLPRCPSRRSPLANSPLPPWKGRRFTRSPSPEKSPTCQGISVVLQKIDMLWCASLTLRLCLPGCFPLGGLTQLKSTAFDALCNLFESIFLLRQPLFHLPSKKRNADL